MTCPFHQVLFYTLNSGIIIENKHPYKNRHPTLEGTMQMKVNLLIIGYFRQYLSPIVRKECNPKFRQGLSIKHSITQELAKTFNNLFFVRSALHWWAGLAMLNQFLTVSLQPGVCAPPLNTQQKITACV